MEKCEKLLSHKNVQAEDIPDIDLYMDQVTGYIDKVLQNFVTDKDDKILTKTMINNYVKAKLIDQPIKKKYNKNQIMELIMIYHFKNILSISDIEKLFKLISTKIEEEKSNNSEDKTIETSIYTTENLYSTFLEIQEEVLEDAKNKFEEHINKENNIENTIKQIIKLVLEADINKRLAELMFKELID